MFFVVFGILQADSNGVLMAVLLAAGAAFLLWFFLYIRARERAGKEPLLSTGLFKNRTSNLGLVTQNIQWLLLMGTSRSSSPSSCRPSAATTPSRPASSSPRRRSASWSRRSPPSDSPSGARRGRLIIAGFVVTVAGIGLLLALVGASSRVVAFAPGLLLIGLGLGVMLTPSVNVVQSSFPEELQGEISGLSRSVSNLGSSFGTAIAGTILGLGPRVRERRRTSSAMVVLAVLALVGLAAAVAAPTRAAPHCRRGRVEGYGPSPRPPPGRLGIRQAHHAEGVEQAEQPGEERDRAARPEGRAAARRC